MADTRADLSNILGAYWSLLLGNTVEWYEFAVYGLVERQMQEHFFPGSSIDAWLGFAVTFFARPVGGAVFGFIADSCGRSNAVNLSLLGMLVGTVGQGCLPTYANGEAAGTVGLFLLIMLRLLQGLSAAGELSSISTYIAEVSRPESLGRCVSLISVTASLGFLAAKAVTFGLETVLGQERHEAWGWRIAFVLSLIPGLTAVWGRRHLPESEVFLEARRSARAVAQRGSTSSLDGAAAEEDGCSQEATVAVHTKPSLQEVVSSQGISLLIGIGAVVSKAVLQYGGFVWLNTYLATRGMTPDGTMLAALVSRAVMIILAVPVGWLTDQKGVAWVVFVAAVLLAVCGVPLFSVLAAHPADSVVGALVLGLGFGTVGTLVGSTFYLYVVELFPTEVRGVAVGLSLNLGFCIFGGLAPTVAQASLAVSPLGPGFMLSFGGLVTALTVLCAQYLQRQGRVRLTHIRHRPYFSSRLLCARDHTVKDPTIEKAGASEDVNHAPTAEEGAPAERCDGLGR